MPSDQATKQKMIEVHVAFPISPGGPFHEKFAPDTAISLVRQAAMTHFGVADDGQHAYYLTQDGQKVSEESSLADVAGHSASVKFTLVKELVQG